MTIVHSLELGRYGVRVNCISPGARTRQSLHLPGGLKSLTQDTPAPGAYDPWDPIHQAVVAAYLATANCPLSGQVLTVRGSTVTVNHNWSLGDHVSKDNAGWTVPELARALEKLPIEDHFDKLAYVRRAYNITSREQLQHLLNAILDTDEHPKPAR